MSLPTAQIDQRDHRDTVVKDSRHLLRVLHVVHWPTSGITSFLKNFLKAASNSSALHSIIFFESDAEEAEAFKQFCNSVVCLNFREHPLQALWKFFGLIRRWKPDIIHTHSFQPGFWARIFSLGTGAKIVSTVHSPYPYLKGDNKPDSLKRFLEISGMNFRNSRVVCVSEEVKRHLNNYTGLKVELLEVIRNGIVAQEADLYEISRACKELGVNGDTKIILTAGRLSSEKGLDILLSALGQIVRKKNDVRLVILGKGPLEEELRKYAAQLDIETYVHFLGYKRNIIPYLALARLYVNSSYYEGLPMSILEAMAAGVPVVASTAGGIPEIVENNVTGILVKSGDASSLADAIMHVLYDEPMARRLAGNAMKKVIRDFHIYRTVQAYETLYLGLVKKRDKFEQAVCSRIE